MALINKFPGIPREGQAIAIPKIEQAIKDKYKYIIIQGQTGTGKSHLGATMAYNSRSYSEGEKLPDGGTQFGAFVLTITTQLQEQYNELFPDSTLLMGKSNYMCELDGVSPCNHAVCMLDRAVIGKCMSNNGCQYYGAYREAMLNKFSVLNYNMFLSLPEDKRQRDILICDEATELEGALINMHSINIRYEILADIYKINLSPLTSEVPKDVFAWLTGLMSSIEVRLSELGQRATPSKGYTPDKSTISMYTKVKNMKEKINTVINTWYGGHYVIEVDEEGVKLAPLQAKNVSNSVFDYADTIILMSATICNHRKFADTLGIGSDEYCFIDVESDFNPKNSPIFSASAVHDLRYSNIRTNLPKAVKDICEICEMHEEDNGIIHTHNFTILSAVKRAIGNNPRFLFREDGATNDDLLFEHYMNPEPTVLVSPSLSFGTSLDDVHGRFQIIAKLPYLPLGDKRIKILANMDYEWYMMKMLVTLIQASGRCTRSNTDHSKTYIMDKAFINTIMKNRKDISNCFIDRIV